MVDSICSAENKPFALRRQQKVHAPTGRGTNTNAHSRNTIPENEPEKRKKLERAKGFEPSTFTLAR
jgi:hypothetical protein